MASQKKEIVVVSEKTGLLREFLMLVEQFGYYRIFMTGLMILFMSYIGYLSVHPDMIFERYRQFDTEKHAESFHKRMENSPMIQSSVDMLALEADAKRSFIIEMHNGKYNPAGLSFNYGSLTYEGLTDTSESIREDYADFSLERFPLTLHIYNSGYWGGTTEQLKSIDKRLAMRLESNGTYYIAAASIYGVDDNIGYIGVTYSDTTGVDINRVKGLLLKYSSKVSPLLDTRNKQKE